MKNSLLLLLCSVSINVFSQTYSGGSGTSPDPFVIANKNDLKYLSEHAPDWSNYFIQTANITFTSSDYSAGGNFYNGGNFFFSIGNSDTSFTGSYDGQNYFIDSLRINRPSQYYLGFFGGTDDATVKNVNLRNVDFTGDSNMGGLIGFADNYSIISNSSCTGTVTAVNGGAVGGLIGGTQYSTVTNCFANCTSTGTDGVGGLIGIHNQSTVSNSYADGIVNAGDQSGGFVGSNSGTITNCYTTANITGGYSIGGFVGWSYAHDINNCYSTGSVTGDDRVGSFMGTNEDALVTNCYATGLVTGNTNIGGFVGFVYLGTYNHCFWNTETTGQASSNGVTIPAITAQMKLQSTFTDSLWDFVGETVNGTDDFWKMGQCSNDGFPVLNWQTITSYPDVTTSVNGLTISAALSGASYQWMNCGTNSIVAGETNQTFTAAANGNYAVIISNNGCTDTSACIAITTVGIKEIWSSNLSVYPVPTRGEFSIDLGGTTETVTMLVRNELGQLMFSKNYANTSKIQETIDGAAGIYFIELVADQDEHARIRIIKQ